MKKTFTLLLLLSGCAYSQPYAQCDSMPSWVQRANCQNHVAYDFPYPGSDEIVAYRKILIERVYQKKMTEAEAEYAMAEKAAEMSARIQTPTAVYVAPQPQPAPQRDTECKRTLNGFKCSPTGPDLSVFQR